VIPDYIGKSIRDAIVAGMAREPKDRPKSISEWLIMLPLTFRDVWRIEGKVLEFDPNDPDQGTYNLNERKVNTSKSKAPQLRSAKGIDYRELEQLLEDKKWYEADQLTYRLMLKVSEREKEEWMDLDSIRNFPCKDLQTIDNLWIHYSNGFYGFSIQKKIYVECGGKLDLSYPSSRTWGKFCERTEWENEYSIFTGNNICVKGYLPHFCIIFVASTNEVFDPSFDLDVIYAREKHVAVGWWFRIAACEM